MKTIALLISPGFLLFGSCSTAQSPSEGMSLKEAILGTSKALTEAEHVIENDPKDYKTFGLRPSKATVAFDLSVTNNKSATGQLNVAPTTSPVGGSLGWTVSKQTQTGNHIVLEFSPIK